jgi:hypothetical protein
MFWAASCLAQSAAACGCYAASAAVRTACGHASARIQFSLVFTASIVISWLMRDFARPLIEKIPCEGGRPCGWRPGAVGPRIALHAGV